MLSDWSASFHANETPSIERQRKRAKISIWTLAWHLNSHFAQVAVDVSHKKYIALGLWGDEGWDFITQLEFIKNFGLSC